MKNINNQSIDRIVQELIEIAPELSDKQAELRDLVAKLMEQKPTVKVDAEFVARLRNELLKTEKSIGTNPIESFNNYMTKLKYAIGGSVVVASLFIVGLIATTPIKNPAMTDGVKNFLTRQGFSSLAGVVEVAPNGFGSLAMMEGAEMEASLLAPPSRIEAGVGVNDAVLGLGAGAPIGSTMEIRPTEIGILPQPINYKPIELSYEGEDLPVFEAEMPVYRRVKGINHAGLLNAITGQNNGLIDLARFPNLSVESLSLKQSTGDGYWIHLSVSESSASMSYSYSGADPIDFSAGQVLSDSELLSLADEFVKKYALDISAYGEPIVDNNWRNLAWPTDGQSKPTVMSVVYPIKNDGKNVLGFDGQPQGMRVNISTIRRAVDSVAPISVQRYESSSYQVETDTQEIIELALKGGMSGLFHAPEQDDVNYSLGTPELHYVLYHRYDNVKHQTDELHIPALFFPLEKKENQYRYSDFVIVPLVKDIFDQHNEQRQNDLIPIAEPFLESNGSAESDAGQARRNETGGIEIVAPNTGDTVKLRVE